MGQSWGRHTQTLRSPVCLNRDVTLDCLNHSKYYKRLDKTHGLKRIFTAAVLKSPILENKLANWSNRPLPKKKTTHSTFRNTKLPPYLFGWLFSSRSAPPQHSPRGCVSPRLSVWRRELHQYRKKHNLTSHFYFQSIYISLSSDFKVRSRIYSTMLIKRLGFKCENILQLKKPQWVMLAKKKSMLLKCPNM